MDKWLHTIHLKKLIESDKESFTADEIVEKTRLFWKIVTPKKFMSEFTEEYAGMYEPETMGTVQDFDELLEHLYNFCDYNRIWVA